MYGKALKEVYEVIDNMSLEDTKLISSSFLKRLYNAVDWNCNFQYDTSKSFKEQKLSEDAKVILTIVYIRYFATVEEKKDILKLIKKD